METIEEPEFAVSRKEEEINKSLVGPPSVILSKPLEVLTQYRGTKVSRVPDMTSRNNPKAGACLSDSSSPTHAPNVACQPSRTAAPRATGLVTRPAAPESTPIRHEKTRATPQTNELDTTLNFTIAQIVKKQLRQGEIKYRIRWEPSWVASDSVFEGNEGRCCVAVQRKFWEVVETLEERIHNGAKEYKVQWKNTWEPARNIDSSEGVKVAAFEADQTDRRRCRDEKLKQRRILTISESDFSSGQVLPQSEEDYAAAQRHVALHWPEIKPHESLDLYPAIFQIQKELLGGKLQAHHRKKSYLTLLASPQVRPLRWRKDYVNSGRTYYFSACRRNALIFQAVGIQNEHDCCSRCTSEEGRVVPFVECVHSSLTQTSWFEGACTNCAIQGRHACEHYTGLGFRGMCLIRTCHSSFSNQSTVWLSNNSPRPSNFTESSASPSSGFHAQQ